MTKHLENFCATFCARSYVHRCAVLRVYVNVMRVVPCGIVSGWVNKHALRHTVSD